MTQEEKQLLLVDLSARLPYGVVCVGITYDLDDDGERYVPVKVKNVLIEIHNYKLETASVRLGLVSVCKLETVKPYLRPMSSMTEEELREYEELCFIYDTSDGTVLFGKNGLDWLNVHHFDYRGLIEQDLAIAVTKENNPYERTEIRLLGEHINNNPSCKIIETIYYILCDMIYGK